MVQDDIIQPKTESNTDQQEAMTFLRERFLYLLSSLCAAGEQCTVEMYENTHVECRVVAVDANFDNVLVENLLTPIPVPINKAILRTNDIISMKFSSSVINLFK